MSTLPSADLARLAQAPAGTPLTEIDLAAIGALVADHSRLAVETAQLRSQVAGLQSDLSLSQRRIALARMRPRA